MSLTISNPLVLYRALLAINRIAPDPAQHRLALHLQKLYERLKDYEPMVDYSRRLNEISRAVDGPTEGITAESQSIGSRGIWSSLLAQKEKRDSLALTRRLTSYESALQLDSPKGLMLHGEVGTGKSMLVDLFFTCLPNGKKRRWHYNTFMLDTFAKLEQLRQSRLQRDTPSSFIFSDEDHSLLWLARDMIKTSPILFLDEFQLPDRAASKIITNLMTGFFHLGGVLIATSNRMPEELSKAAGMDFAPPPPSRLESLGWRLGLRAGKTSAGRSENMFAGKGEFVAFLEVLRARCDVWEMESRRDYRRSEFRSPDEEAVPAEERAHAQQEVVATHTHTAPGANEPISNPITGVSDMVNNHTAASLTESLLDEALNGATTETATLPKYYFVKPHPAGSTTIMDAWNHSFNTALLKATGRASGSVSTIPWSAGAMRVYGRTVPVPRHYNGVTAWTFAQLCGTHLGPADYITLASTFHSVVVTDVPVLTLIQKNEARRFITLLDALYEARCKLLISAAAGPDGLFFPEGSAPAPAAKDATDAGTVDQDAVYSEVFSDIYQDANAPFRPNISSYDSGPDHTHVRLQGILADDALEDDPPNRVRKSVGASGFEEHQDILKRGPDFGHTSAFTGEDERFAYKRARSRLWEMCGAKWWSRNEEEWWKPLPIEARGWERSASERAVAAAGDVASLRDDHEIGVKEGMGPSRGIDEKDEVLFRHGASPFRSHAEPPPKISWTHVWGTVKWGKKAGAWGQGVEGLVERKKKKDED